MEREANGQVIPENTYEKEKRINEEMSKTLGRTANHNYEKATSERRPKKKRGQKKEFAYGDDGVPQTNISLFDMKVPCHSQSRGKKIRREKDTLGSEPLPANWKV